MNDHQTKPAAPEIKAVPDTINAAFDDIMRERRAMTLEGAA